MENKDLKKLYDKSYKNGINETFYSMTNHEEILGFLNYHDWSDKDVLDIGCGEGEFLSMLKGVGINNAMGVDFSKESIKICNERYNLKNCEFITCDYRDVKEKFDVVTMIGVLEHMDDPLKTLKYIKNNLLKDKNSVVITSSPSFLNPRGYVWMTLQLLFDIPMSLSDLHFLTPTSFEGFSKELDFTYEYKSCNQKEGVGNILIRDFKKRLTNALRDKKMSGNVDKLLEWLHQTENYNVFNENTGVNIIYKLKWEN